MGFCLGFNRIFGCVGSSYDNSAENVRGRSDVNVSTKNGGNSKEL